MVPYSSIANKLSDSTSALNRIENTSKTEMAVSTGNDVISSIAEKSNNKFLTTLGKTLNKINIAKTLYSTIKDLFDTKTVGKEQFIENEFYDVLKSNSRGNVVSLYGYAKEHVDNFVDCGYIELTIDKKGVLKGFKINNQTAIDMLYNDLKNMQIKLRLEN